MKALDSMGDVLLGKSDKDSNITLESPKLKMSVAKIPTGNGILYSTWNHFQLIYSQ